MMKFSLLFLAIHSCSAFIPVSSLNRRDVIYTGGVAVCDLFMENNEKTNIYMNATDKERHSQLSLHFYGSVTEESCLELTQALFALDKQAQHQKVDNPQMNPFIELHIQSPGGSLMPAFYVCDVIKQIDTPVYTYVDGFVASAASLISVCGQKRYITKYSSMLIHQLKGATSGKYSEIKDELSNLNVFMEKVIEIYMINSNLNRTLLEDLLSTDIWLDSDTCLKYGLVDVML